MWKRKAGIGGDASFSVAGKDKVDFVPFISHHGPYTTYLIPTSYQGERHIISHVGLSGPLSHIYKEMC